MSNASALLVAGQRFRTARVSGHAFVRQYPRVAAAAAFVGLLFLVALLAPLIAPHDPLAVHPDDSYLPPLSPSHLLGTDELWRDLFSPVLWGARGPLPVAFLPGGCGRARVWVRG